MQRPRMRKEPVHFEIPVEITIFGIPKRSYQNGTFSTRNVKQIAMLRRLVKASRIKEVDALPPVVVPVTYGVEEKTWTELRKMGRDMDLYKVGMPRSQLIQAIIKRKREKADNGADT